MAAAFAGGGSYSYAPSSRITFRFRVSKEGKTGRKGKGRERFRHICALMPVELRKRAIAGRPWDCGLCDAWSDNIRRTCDSEGTSESPDKAQTLQFDYFLYKLQYSWEIEGDHARGGEAPRRRMRRP